jgi:Na+/melibiose symporter-like transporter
VRAGSVMQAYLGSTFQLAAFFAVFVFRRLSIRIGKLRAIQLALGLHVLSTALKLLMYDPAHPWHQIVIYIANGGAFAGVEILAASMLADITDVAEWETGTRDESVYWSLTSFCDKTCGAVGILLSGFLLLVIGFNSGISAAQSAETLRVMRWCYAGFPCLCAVVAILVIRTFPITEATATLMKSQLERRRAAAALSDAALADA